MIMKVSVVFCALLFVGVSTVVSQVAEKPDASPFQHLLTKELGRMAKNIHKQLHSEMSELVEELRQKFLQTSMHFETSSDNTSVDIRENMIKEKNMLEDRFMKVVNYTSHHMEELTNGLQYLQLVVKGDINPSEFHKLLASEAPMSYMSEEQSLVAQPSEMYLNDQFILLYTKEPESYFNDEGSDPTTSIKVSDLATSIKVSNPTSPVKVSDAALRPDALIMTLNISKPRSCYDLYQDGNIQNGKYIIYPEGPVGMGIAVWCIMELGEGGWTVILARLPDVEHVTFSRPMHDYVIGFGQPDGHYWMGLRHMESLCGFKPQKLKVYMQDWDENQANADYDNFSISKSNESWSLQISGYHTASTAGDSLTSQNGTVFTSTQELGGWWHSNKGGATPTGKYYTQDFIPLGREAGVVWPTWKGYTASLKKLLIMIRSKN